MRHMNSSSADEKTPELLRSALSSRQKVGLSSGMGMTSSGGAGDAGTVPPVGVVGERAPLAGDGMGGTPRPEAAPKLPLMPAMPRSSPEWDGA